MTPDQQRLIDAAAKVYYERVNAFSEDHGLPYTKWDDLSQEYKEDLLYPVVIGPVTVALRAAASICSIKAAECRDKQADVSDESVNWHAYNHGAFVAGANAAAISSLIPAQEKTNDA
jgi:hypothetical protein